MTTKTLNTRQVRWAELLAQFNFLIKFRPGKSNAVADAITQLNQDVTTQNKTKTQLRQRALLQRGQYEESPYWLNVNFMETFEITEKLLWLNWEVSSLEDKRNIAWNKSDSWFKIEDGVLIYDQDRLVVPDVDNIRTALVKEAHGQPSTAHPGSKKTLQLLSARYYWKGMKSFINQFISNCHPCRQSHINHDKTPGFLHSFPTPNHTWQHICMDFKEMPEDNEGFNMVVVFIDRLSKKAVNIPCKKTVNAKYLAEIYFVYCFCHLGLPDSVVSDCGPQFISYFWG